MDTDTGIPNRGMELNLIIPFVFHAEKEFDFAGFRKFYGIPHQVDQYLAEAPGISLDICRYGVSKINTDIAVKYSRPACDAYS